MADWWREALNGIGSWEIVLDPIVNYWPGLFNPADEFTISVDGVIMMRGYLDDVLPYITPEGVYTDLYRLVGRDHGFDLAELYHTGNYENTRGDDLIDAVLLAEGSEIIYTSPSAAPVVDEEFDRTWLTDGFAEVAQKNEYDFYVDDLWPAPAGPNLHYFDLATMGGGVEHTAVDLISIADDITNNVLRLDPLGEKIGFGLKNSLEAHAGWLADHWTDLNAAHFTPRANNVVTDEVGAGGIFLYNKGAIRITATANVPIRAYLQFPLYEYTVLDLSRQATGRFSVWPHITGTLNKMARIRLHDIFGGLIEFYKTTGRVDERTDNLNNDRWRWIQFPYGEDTEIDWTPWTTDMWNAVGPVVTFDWSQVDRISFNTDQGFNQNVGDYLIIDGLELPTIEVRSIEDDLVSQAAYRKRMIPIYRPDIPSQVELDAYTAYEINKYKDPYEKIHCTAIGQTGSRFAAQSLDFRAPDRGIATLTPYRIMSLHHSIRARQEDREIIGWDHLTEYDLIKHQINGSVQQVGPLRLTMAESPVQSSLNKTRLQQGYRSARTRDLPI